MTLSNIVASFKTGFYPFDSAAIEEIGSKEVFFRTRWPGLYFPSQSPTSHE
jgi:hypothetical protein